MRHPNIAGILDKRRNHPDATAMATVVLQGVSRSFRNDSGHETQALREVSLEVSHGELLTLVGPSGSGKTTTLRLIAGLDEPSAGAILIDGKSMDGVPPHERDIAMVFQDHPLFPHLTVEQNLGFALRLRGMSVAEIRHRVEESAAWLGVTELLGRMPHALSGGERQRVALGTAVVRRPGLLLLDEPLAQLDLPLRLQLRTEIRRLQRRMNTTVILVTHDQSEAMALGDRLAILSAGELQQAGPPLVLYRRPATAFVAGFLGSPPMNLLEGRCEWTSEGPWFVAHDGTRWKLPLSAHLPATYLDRPLFLGFRAEDVHVTPDDPGDAAFPGLFTAEVEAIEPLGAESWMRLRLGSTPFIARVQNDWSPRDAHRASVSFAAENLHWFEAPSGRRL